MARLLAVRFLSTRATAWRATARPPASASTTTPRPSWSAKSVWNRPTRSWARASASGAGPIAGSVRCKRRNSASTITPRGELVGLRTDPPKMPRAPIPIAAAARALAEDFLRTRLNRDPAIARLRRSLRRRPPPSHGPRLHLEGARFRPARRHQSPGSDASSATKSAAIASTSRCPTSGRATTSACAPRMKWRNGRFGPAGGS